MSFIRQALLAVVCIFLAGCQTTPRVIARPQFSPPPQPERGRILFNMFQIPKSDPGLLVYALFAPRGGLASSINTSIYDVTSGAHYLGSADTGVSSAWLEYDVEPGRRTLMLTRTPFGNFPTEVRNPTHVDFIELEVKPGTTHFVAISNYGLSRNPFFGRLAIENQHYEACKNFNSIKVSLFGNELTSAIDEYMSRNGIPPEAKSFHYFCRNLAQPYFLKPKEADLAEFKQAKLVIDANLPKYHEEWAQSGQGKAEAPYDLQKPDPSYASQDDPLNAK